MTDISESGLELLPCPFCGGAMQLRYALWPSEGDRDAVIHNVPGGTACPIEGAFSIDTFDNGVSVAEAWNRRHPPAREEGLRSALAHVEAVRVSPQWSGKNADWICGAIRFELEQDLLSALQSKKP